MKKEQNNAACPQRNHDMIPKIIHYCWFGRGEMPELAQKCLASWHRYMPDWEYKLWNEDNFDVTAVPYVREAYEARKFAFVSDYVRLFALETEGGLYMDVDFEVFKPFDDLLGWHAFAGVEGSKYNPVMMGVVASEPHGQWVNEQLSLYVDRPFVLSDGSLDMEANTSFITHSMVAKGFVCDGKEKDYLDLHVFPVDYFCPLHTTGEYIATERTYCAHRGLDSWSSHDTKGMKGLILRIVGPKTKTTLIKLKRKFIG